MIIKPKLCIVSTVPFVLRIFMLEHIENLAKNYEITLVANQDFAELNDILGSKVNYVIIPIQRKVSIFLDLSSIVKLYYLFSKCEFSCVLSIMPKSGLLSMVAARVAKIPVRIHFFTGQVWYTKTGLARKILKYLDFLLVNNATQLLTDSPSQREFLLREGVVSPEKISVLGKGSISGVDLNRFAPHETNRIEIRRKLDIKSDAVVFLYMARVTRDKGVLDLAQAFKNLYSNLPNAFLLIIGPDEDGIEEILESRLSTCSDRVHRITYTFEPEKYMAASDVFVLPSYREGFSSVTIQAAACDLPAIVSRVYGLVDAVEENVSGIFHKAGSIVEIEASMSLLYHDKTLRLKMGKNAGLRARQDFRQEIILRAMSQYLEKLI